MPEFRLDAKKNRINPPEIKAIDNISMMGTLSTYRYLDASVHYINSLIENLETVASANPTVVYPVIDWMKDVAHRTNEKNQELLHDKKLVFDDYEKSVQEYKEIINSPDMRENNLQDFFLKNPEIIDLKITKLIPKQSFGGEKYPDFIAVLTNKKHILIEIEKPKDPIYKTNGDPSPEFIHAEQQIQDYLRWANEDKDYLQKPARKIPLPEISIENTSGLLVIGKIASLGMEEKRKLQEKNMNARITK